MPMPEGTKYRYKKGTKIRRALTPKGKVMEAKNMMTGATHTPEEFAEDARHRRMRKAMMR